MMLSKQDAAHHQIFEQIPPHVGSRRSGILLDYVGAEFPGIWDRQPDVAAIEGAWTLPKPQFDEEYFEWIDFLESVRDARSTYTMLELGAGYGRWGVRAGIAAKRRGLHPIKLIFVEGEPKHARWLREAVALNGLADFSTIHENAISYGGHAIPFIVSHDSLDVGFGQCLGWEGAGSETNETYFGKPVRRTESGYGQINVEPITLEEVTADHDLIDFIDMDLQRAELDLVRHSMSTLDQKVRRVHIGTHSTEIEDELRQTFKEHCWRNVWDFGCLRTNITPYGEITFVDGVQGWINPRRNP